MPVQNYGVWKAHPIKYTVEHAHQDPRTPHLSLYFTSDDAPSHPSTTKHHHQPHPPTTKTKDIPNLNRAAINIKSGDRAESRLVYWVNENLIDHHIIDSLSNLPYGFQALDEIDHEGLDYIRGNLFTVHSGRILPHDIQGRDNDIIDVLEPRIKWAIEQQADIYLFGSQFNSKNGIHNIHMNQGNISSFRQDDGVWQDGGMIFHSPREGKWVGVFLAFASQAAHTDDEEGHKIGVTTWADLLDRHGAGGRRRRSMEDSVAIVEVNVGSGRHRLGNRTTHPVALADWRIHNSLGQVQEFPRGAVVDPRATMEFEAPMCPLSERGDTVTLLNQEGLKVHGLTVSYLWLCEKSEQNVGVLLIGRN
ncbi:hypothetical protein BO94DRAFT_576227 [Aspergillus sclerotioniger CBS 115572]|uniref:Uncharacterized protein n=1 Tax=Aspergillus sclerotioniger CBS 115572 TaxID=1450535 RepID=A0A317WBD5_9EURO|nr:hypothetical protein BO94DRAFT_576227 [Aspergillus sclerotioniger CBS 115572]PWY83806.1 hypothetical protein BO94DRAFT_576227 [Aspergillus sclerotioniger CBS 115572]